MLKFQFCEVCWIDISQSMHLVKQAILKKRPSDTFINLYKQTTNLFTTRILGSLYPADQSGVDNVQRAIRLKLYIRHFSYEQKLSIQNLSSPKHRGLQG